MEAHPRRKNIKQTLTLIFSASLAARNPAKPQTTEIDTAKFEHEATKSWLAERSLNQSPNKITLKL
jgi:hypothetical protein